MEPSPFGILYGFRRFAPSANPYTDGVILDGRNWVLRGAPPVLEVHNGVAAGGASPGQACTFAVGPAWGSIANGGGILWKNNSLWYDGFGNFYYNGALIGSPGGALRVKLSGGSDYPAGLPAPSTAPGLTAGAVSQKMRGSYGLEFSWGRSATGAVSNPSPPADLTLNNQFMVAQFPVEPSAQGIDQIIPWGTPRGLGTVGPFKSIPKYDPILISSLGAGRTKSLEWNDNELGATFAPTANQQPPAATGYGFVVSFGNTIVILCTYGGAGISFSGNTPEAYDPLDTIFAEPFEQINGCWTRGANGFALFSTANSLQTIYPGGGIVKVALRRIWGEDGIPAGQKGGCIARGVFYCYTGAGPGRLVAEGAPDDSFAVDVQGWMRAFFDPTTVVVGYDPRDQQVIYCGQVGAEWVAVPFRLQTQDWGIPITLPAQPIAAVTYGTRLYLVIGTTLRQWDAAGGTLTGTPYLRSGFETGQVGFLRKDVERARLLGSAGLTSNLYRGEEDDDPPSYTNPIVGPAAGQGNVPVFCPRSAAIAAEVIGTTPGQRFYGIDLEGHTDPRRFR